MTRSILSCIALLAAVASCTSDEPAGPDGNIDYEGTWTGDIGDPSAVLRLGVTWTPTHSHNAVTGPIAVRLNQTLTATGTLSANVVGTVLEFTLSIPGGAYPSPISQACTLTASGISSTATATNIVALLAMNWTAPCLGTVTTVNTANHRITLFKQE